MTHLLFPGRHHLLTNFQLHYLNDITSRQIGELNDYRGKPLEGFDPIESILWVVTSANHSNTRRNPIPANRREAAIERFADAIDADSFVFPIDDIGTTPRFAEYVIKKVGVESRGRFQLSPENTIVACSTPSVIEMYEELGYRILPVELSDPEADEYAEATPWQILNSLIESGLNGVAWENSNDYLELTSEATRTLYEKYRFEELILSLHRSPLLTEDGDLTETRDYNTYVRSFDDGASRKFERVQQHIRPGRIVDIGCCTGALLREISFDDRFRESDLYGIEVARPLYVECCHRKEQNHFGNDNVFFYQQNFAAGPVFPDESIDSFLTFALTHEIESYGGRDALLGFLDLIYRQTASRGRWLNVDVVGPENKDKMVWVRFCSDDGSNDEFEKQFEIHDREGLKSYLSSLSTQARFRRFARDFRKEEGYALRYREVIGEAGMFEMRLEDLYEFLSKKDYVDNWTSEMHEKFCFWSFSDWVAAVEDVGFRIAPESEAFQNPWIIENRYAGKAEIFEPGSDTVIPFDVTNMLLIAEKV